MILSPDHRFIFIHVPKAAGTSINAALSLHDAFFPVRHADAAVRRRHAEKISLPPATADLTEHASAAQFIRALGRDAYAGYFSFGFVRNPWDVAVSWYHYRLINSQISGHAEAAAAGSFRNYVLKHFTQAGSHKRVGLQHPFLTDETGAVALSFVGRYESLLKDWDTVRAGLKVETLPLDHFNQSYHAPWAELYTRETFAIIAGLVGADARLFGYPEDPAAYGIS